jgi:1-acyl-sn-glycerol-3-phosphate acyltransferase
MTGVENSTDRAGAGGEETAELRRALAELRTGLRGAVSADPVGVGSGRSRRRERTLRSRASSSASSSDARNARIFSLFDELRSLVSSASASERSGEIDEFGLDRDALDRAARWLDVLFDGFDGGGAVAVLGAERLPLEGPCLCVSNGAGMLAWEGLMLAHALSRLRPEWPRARFLADDWLIAQPFAQPLLVRLGAVRARPENVDRLLCSGRSVIAFAQEGRAPAQGPRERDRIQRFGFGAAIRSGARACVPLVPIAVALPPRRWQIVVGEPLALPPIPGEPEGELEIRGLRRRLRARMQGLQGEARAERARSQ